MPVDWKAPDSFLRLLAATVASMDGHMKLNYKRIADFYGQGATYDAIEGRFRHIKKEAHRLKDEVDNGREIAPERGNGSGSKANTPKKPRTQGVLTGRVTKPNSSSTKKNNAQVKAERLELSTSASNSSSAEDASTPASSTNNANNILVEDSFGYGSTLGSFEHGYGAVNNQDHLNNGISFVGPEGSWDIDSFLDVEHVV